MIMHARNLLRGPSRRLFLHPLRGWHDVASPGRLGDPAPAADLPAALRFYLRMLHESPLAVTTATAVSAAAIGDSLAQLVAWSDVEARYAAWATGDGTFQQHSPYRGRMQTLAELSAEPTLQEGASVELGPIRTLRFALLAGALGGGGGELWFRRALLPTFPGWTYEVALRTAFDLAFFAPAVLGVVVGATALATTRGDGAYAVHKLRLDWAHSLGKMWTLWCGGAAASYLLVPTPWQPPFAAGLGVVWACYVSRRVHLPTARRGFDVTHSPEKVGSYLRAEAARALEGQAK